MVQANTKKEYSGKENFCFFVLFTMYFNHQASNRRCHGQFCKYRPAFRQNPCFTSSSPNCFLSLSSCLIFGEHYNQEQSLGVARRSCSYLLGGRVYSLIFKLRVSQLFLSRFRLCICARQLNIGHSILLTSHLYSIVVAKGH